LPITTIPNATQVAKILSFALIQKNSNSLILDYKIKFDYLLIGKDWQDWELA
jgi:hypothetical protein